MKFGRSLLSPSYQRKPDFKSWPSMNSTFEFECINCRNEISFEFDSIIGKQWTWRDDFAGHVVDEINRFYDINIVGKSPDGGWPAVTTVRCEDCQTTYLIYAGVNEASNSFYIVTLQGITELVDS